MKTNTIRLTQKKPKKAVRIAQKKQTKIERLSKIMLIGTVLCICDVYANEGFK